MKKQDLQNLYEFQSKSCQALLLTQLLMKTGRGGQSAARDYIHANAVLAELMKVNGEDLSRFPDLKSALMTLHPAVRFRLSFYTPCLAYRYDELKPAEQKDFFDNKRIMFTEKQNGLRGIFVYYKGESFLFSRNYSDKDCSLPEYWGNVAQTVQFDDPNEIYAMDCEVKFEPGANLKSSLAEYGIDTDSKLEAICALIQMNAPEANQIQNKFKDENGRDLIVFRCIHPLYYKGHNYMKKTLGEGKKVYHEAVAWGVQHGLNIKEIDMCIGDRIQKENFLNTIIDAGGEGCFWRNNRVTMADYSKKRICDIKEGDLVLSYNTILHKVEPAEVEAVFDNGWRYPKDIALVDHHLESSHKYKNTSNTMNDGYSRIYSTLNHRFYNGNEFKEITKVNKVYEVDPVIDEYRFQAVLGWILSDGGVCSNGDIYLLQKQDHPYWSFTKDMFKPLYKSELIQKSGKDSIIGKIMLLHKYTKELQKFYNKEEKKEDYKAICKVLNPIGMAYMFMGDGSGDKSKYIEQISNDRKGSPVSLEISLHSFSKEDLEAVQDCLLKYDICTTQHKDKRVKTGYGCSLRMNKENSIKFGKLIGKYVHDSMRYKLLGHQIEDFMAPPEIKYDIFEQSVKYTSNVQNSIKKYHVYDLEIEGNHDYFIENVLVHNCVGHFLDGYYCTSDNRSKMSFVKLKRSVGGAMSKSKMGDSIDGWISGFKLGNEDTGNEGLVSAFEVSINLLKSDGRMVKHVIAYVPNIPLEMKKAATIIGEDGNPTLNPDFLNLVLEVDGQNISKVSRRLTHPKFLRFRTDKTKEDCIFSEEFINSQID